MSNELFDRVTEQYARMHPHSYVSLTPTVGDPLVDQSIFEKSGDCKKKWDSKSSVLYQCPTSQKRLKELLESPLDHLELSLSRF